MAKIDTSSLLKKVCLDDLDISALRRLVEMAVPRRGKTREDAFAIKRVASLIETAAVAHEQSLAAIGRIIKERQDAGEPGYE